MSKNHKNNYPLEFKISSAQLAVDSNQPIAQTARDLGVIPIPIFNDAIEFFRTRLYAPIFIDLRRLAFKFKA